MIYIIDDGSHYKINFTTKINKWLNMKQNKRNYKVISYKPGLRGDVYNIKQLIKDYKFKGEWYNKDQKVLDIFNQYKWTSHFDFNKMWEAYKNHLISNLQNLDFYFFKYNGLDIYDIRQLNADLIFCKLPELDSRTKCLEEFEEMVKAQIFNGDVDANYNIFPGVSVVPGIKLPSEWKQLMKPGSLLETAYKNTTKEANEIIEIIQNSK